MKGEPEVLYKPVWLSSIDHLAAYAEIIKKGRQRGLDFRSMRYPIPEGFPQAEVGVEVPIDVPVMIFARGQLTVENGSMSFEARPIYGAGKFRNMKTDFTFHWGQNEVVSVERYEFSQRGVCGFTQRFPFVRIRSTQPDLADILLAVGRGTLRRHPRATANLAADIEANFPSAAAGARPAAN